MRALAAALALAVVLPCVLFSSAKPAFANEARDALAEAKAAIARQPPDRRAARAALERATGAKDDPNAVGDAFLGLGRLDRDERAYTSALANYRACIAASPDTIWARRASQQVDWLTERAEGNFAPLDRFERVELDPMLMSDPAALDALARDADSFPTGRVRIEARMFVADAWLAQPERRVDAIGELRKVASEIEAVDPLVARTVERELVDALLAEERFSAAAREAKLHGNLLDPPFASYVRRLGRRHTWLRAAGAELVVFVILGVFGLSRTKWKLASALDRRRQAARIATALGIGVSALAAALLLVEAIRPTYLDRVGL